MNKVRRLHLILSGLFSLLVALTLAVEAISFARLSGLQATVVEQTYYGEKLTEKEDILMLLEEKYSLIETDVDLILETLPKDKDASKLVADLNSIAIKSGLKFTNIESRVTEAKSSSKDSKTTVTDPSLLQTVKGADGYEMPISITVEGSYSKLVPFIESIESYQRLVNIVYIQIERVENEEINDYVKVIIDITAYLKK